jgi:hypothetical protein
VAKSNPFPIRYSGVRSSQTDDRETIWFQQPNHPLEQSTPELTLSTGSTFTVALPQSPAAAIQ